MRTEGHVQLWTVDTWMSFLRDQPALLKQPGTRYNTLLVHAHALHRAQVIDRDGLCDLLELADSALAFAVETLLDEPGNE